MPNYSVGGEYVFCFLLSGVLGWHLIDQVAVKSLILSQMTEMGVSEQQQSGLEGTHGQREWKLLLPNQLIWVFSDPLD